MEDSTLSSKNYCTVKVKKKNVKPCRSEATKQVASSNSMLNW